MTFYLIKLAVSAAVVVAVSELAKRSSFLGGFVASLPIVSLMAIGWLYAETRDTQKVAALSWSIFWLVLPSLSFFAIFGILLKRNWTFAPGFAIALLSMVLSYGAMFLILRRTAC